MSLKQQSSRGIKFLALGSSQSIKRWPKMFLSDMVADRIDNNFNRFLKFTFFKTTC
jgi:hypothetical protein